MVNACPQENFIASAMRIFIFNASEMMTMMTRVMLCRRLTSNKSSTKLILKLQLTLEFELTPVLM